MKFKDLDNKIQMKGRINSNHTMLINIKHWSTKPSALSQRSSNHTLKHIISSTYYYNLHLTSYPLPFSPCWRASGYEARTIAKTHVTLCGLTSMLIFTSQWQEHEYFSMTKRGQAIVTRQYGRRTAARDHSIVDFLWWKPLYQNLRMKSIENVTKSLQIATIRRINVK